MRRGESRFQTQEKQMRTRRHKLHAHRIMTDRISVCSSYSARCCRAKLAPKNAKHADSHSKREAALPYADWTNTFPKSHHLQWSLRYTDHTIPNLSQYFLGPRALIAPHSSSHIPENSTGLGLSIATDYRQRSLLLSSNALHSCSASKLDLAPPSTSFCG